MDKPGKQQVPEYRASDPAETWEKFKAVAKKALITPKVAAQQSANSRTTPKKERGEAQ